MKQFHVSNVKIVFKSLWDATWKILNRVHDMRSIRLYVDECNKVKMYGSEFV